LATSAQSASHGSVVYTSMMSPVGPCVTQRSMSLRAPSAWAKEMNVRRQSCCLRLRSPSLWRSSWKRMSDRLALRCSPSRFGAMRSSDCGGRPNKRSHPLSFHSAKILARVGCTGTARDRSVFVEVSTSLPRVPRCDDAHSPKRLLARVVVSPAQSCRFTRPQTAKKLKRMNQAAIFGNAFVRDKLLRLGASEDGSFSPARILVQFARSSPRLSTQTARFVRHHRSCLLRPSPWTNRIGAQWS